MIKFINKNDLLDLPLVIGAFSDEKISVLGSFSDDLNELVEEKIISLEKNKINKIPTFKKIANKTVYVVGLGKKGEYSIRGLEGAVKALTLGADSDLVIDSKTFINSLDEFDALRATIDINSYYEYSYEECKSVKKAKKYTFNVLTDYKDIKALDEYFNLYEIVNKTRDLVNKPYNYLSAEDLANYAVAMCERLKSDKVKYKIYEKEEIKALGMNAFLGVNKGSVAKPKLIYLEYNGKDEDLTALVGKGLMYDTGGYDLKSSMATMKNDMAGAATVLGIFEAIVTNKIKRNISVVICATDNRINGEALLPDDVLTAMNKKTIEIISTDAEGRLTLADAVCFAESKNAKRIIDLATLTGAVVTALGDYTTGILGNDQKLIDDIIEASKIANEHLWQLPITDFIREKVRKSDVADVKNASGRGMGVSSAAAFIEEFISATTSWAHLDIAGTAHLTSPFYQEAPGATGVMVKTLYKYLKDN